MSNSWFESSTLWLEAKAVIADAKSSRLLSYEAILHTPKARIGVYDLNSIEKARDYVGQIGDSIRLRFKTGLGVYAKLIHPFRNNLEMTLYRKEIAEGESGIKKDTTPTGTRYKVIFKESANPPVAASDLENHAQSDLDLSDIVEVYLELVERGLEPFRIKTVGDAIMNQTPENLIHNLIARAASNTLVDGKPCLDAIDIVKPDNTEKIKNMVFPHNTRATSVPTMIHEQQGVYNFGIGSFYQSYRDRKTFFVYPLYSTSRFDSAGYRAVIYLIPQEKLPMLDRSFVEEGKLLKIVATANRLYRDSAEVGMMNGGSGYRFAEARSFMKKPAIIEEDGPIADRARLNHEVIHTVRDDGLDYAPMSHIGPSSNPFEFRSKASLSNVAQVEVVWENANEELLYPGMPIKVVMSNQGKIVSLHGTLLFVHSATYRIGKMNTQAFRTTVRMTIATEIKRDIPEVSSNNGEVVVPGEKSHYLT